jgi:hypothetical protein
MTCDYLAQQRGTRYLGTTPVLLAPGATSLPFRIQGTTANLILGIFPRGFAGLWTSAILRWSARIKGTDSLMKDGIPVGADLTWDEQGVHYMAEPIPLTSDQYVEVWITNDDAVARTVRVDAEIAEMTSEQLVKYMTDDAYRAEVLAALRDGRRR